MMEVINVMVSWDKKKFEAKMGHMSKIWGHLRTLFFIIL